MPASADGVQAGISEAQLDNLRRLEGALRDHWNLGEQLLLCWTPTATGISVLMAPHFFLARFTASLNDCDPVDRLEALNGSFIRKLIASTRQMPGLEFAGTARRLDLLPVDIELALPVLDEAPVLARIEQMAQRFSISFVQSRAVLLFDIVDFSLFTPFEQASQLNSLSHSINASYSKLLQRNIHIDFDRSTTGDGFYLWNRDASPAGNVFLFHLMLLAVANNAIARRHSTAHTVPQIRTGYHIGSHYAFSQADGLNPALNSYIVGDVTIELARILGPAAPGQIVIGDFVTQIPTSSREGAYAVKVDTIRFVERARKNLGALRGLELSGENITSMHCYLTGDIDTSGGSAVRSFSVTDKHGIVHQAYNMRMNIRTDLGSSVLLGTPTAAGGHAAVASAIAAGSAADDYTGFRPAKPMASPGSTRRERA